MGETEEVARAARLVRDLYDRLGCGSGGPMHVVTDDDNVEIGPGPDGDAVAWCLSSPDAWTFVGSDNPRVASVSLALAFAVGLAMLPMSEAERWTVLALVWGYERH